MRVELAFRFSIKRSLKNKPFGTDLHEITASVLAFQTHDVKITRMRFEKNEKRHLPPAQRLVRAELTVLLVGGLGEGLVGVVQLMNGLA